MPKPTEQTATDESVIWDKPPVPRHVGLALGGGAARGAAHIGVLEVLSRYDIPIHCIVGTSAGAIAGGLYAAGMSPEDMATAVVDLRWSQITSLSLPSVHLSSLRVGSVNLAAMSMPLGILDLDRLTEFLVQMLGPRQLFEQLHIPFAAIGTDIAGGRMVVMNDGEVATAIRASCAIPGIFTPYRRNGCLLIDGGAINNLPVSVAHQLGADYVIAVDLLPWERDTPKEPSNIIELSLMSLYSLMRATQSDGPQAHLTIRPDVGHVRLMDLGAAPELIEAGRAATESAIPELLRVLGRAPENISPDGSGEGTGDTSPGAPRNGPHDDGPHDDGPQDDRPVAAPPAYPV